MKFQHSVVLRNMNKKTLNAIVIFFFRPAQARGVATFLRRQRSSHRHSGATVHFHRVQRTPVLEQSGRDPRPRIGYNQRSKHWQKMIVLSVKVTANTMTNCVFILIFLFYFFKYFKRRTIIITYTRIFTQNVPKLGNENGGYSFLNYIGYFLLYNLGITNTKFKNELNK